MRRMDRIYVGMSRMRWLAVYSVFSLYVHYWQSCGIRFETPGGEKARVEFVLDIEFISGTPTCIIWFRCVQRKGK